MKKLDKYIEDLTKKVKVNEKALKIAEKGVDMEKRKYLGYHLPQIKIGENDVILKIETSGLAFGSEIITLGKIDKNGLTLIAKDDTKFHRKLLKMLKDLDGKRVFIYHQNFTMMHLERYLQGLNIEVIDLREEADAIFSYDTIGEGIKSRIDVPWDPCSPEDVPELWANGDVDLIKKHAIAEMIRLHYIYLVYITKNALGINSSGISNVTSSGSQKVKLPTIP